jgi:hypothetical protein
VLIRLSRLILLLTVVPAALATQVTIDSVAGHLRAGQHVRLHVRGGQRLEGQFAVHVLAPPAVRLRAADTLLPLETVDSLWVRGRATKTGAIVGAVVVGVPSAVFWWTACSIIVESECTSWGLVAGLTAASAGVGALVGAGIGTAFPRWHLRYAETTVGLSLTPLPHHRAGVGVSLPFRARLRRPRP